MTDLEKQSLKYLMDVINQSCQEAYDKQYTYVHHQCISTYEDAIYFLEKLGLAKEIKRGKYKGTWRLNWNKLK